MGYKDRPQAFLKKLFTHYRQFAKRESFVPAYCWVLENSLHIHAHILLHFPSNHNLALFKRRLRKSWFKDYAITERGRGSEVKYQTLNYGYFHNKDELSKQLKDIKNQILTNEKKLEYINSNPYNKYGLGQFHDISNLCNYLSKGIAFNAEGQLLGKRCGLSKNLHKFNTNKYNDTNVNF